MVLTGGNGSTGRKHNIVCVVGVDGYGAMVEWF